MKSLVLVGVGGLIGSVLRYGVGAWMLHLFPLSRFPWATLLVNLVGCFAIGVIASVLERVNFYNAELRLLIITGFLGGFTTFSAFGLETLYLIRQDLIGQAVLNVLLSVLVGVIAVWLGLRCAQHML